MQWSTVARVWGTWEKHDFADFFKICYKGKKKGKNSSFSATVIILGESGAEDDMFETSFSLDIFIGKKNLTFLFLTI